MLQAEQFRLSRSLVLRGDISSPLQPVTLPVRRRNKSSTPTGEASLRSQGGAPGRAGRNGETCAFPSVPAPRGWRLPEFTGPGTASWIWSDEMLQVFWPKCWPTEAAGQAVGPWLPWQGGQAQDVRGGEHPALARPSGDVRPRKPRASAAGSLTPCAKVGSGQCWPQAG